VVRNNLSIEVVEAGHEWQHDYCQFRHVKPYPTALCSCRHSEVHDQAVPDGFLQRRGHTLRQGGARGLDAQGPEADARQGVVRNEKAVGIGPDSGRAARDAEAVKTYLKAGMNPNVQDPRDGRTVLIAAAARGDIGVDKALLEGNADLNVKDNAGYTALFHAIEARYDEVSDVLVAHPKLDLNARGKNDITALISYTWRGRADAVQSLLDRGADVNAHDADGDTALHGAAENGNVTIIELLLKKGANPNVKNKVGGTPLMWAAVYGQDAAAKLLLEQKADPSLKDEEGLTARDWAIKNQRTTVVKILSELR
jgi:hypothetical protein